MEPLDGYKERNVLTIPFIQMLLHYLDCMFKFQNMIRVVLLHICY